ISNTSVLEQSTEGQGTVNRRSGAINRGQEHQQRSGAVNRESRRRQQGVRAVNRRLKDSEDRLRSQELGGVLIIHFLVMVVLSEPFILIINQMLMLARSGNSSVDVTRLTGNSSVDVARLTGLVVQDTTGPQDVRSDGFINWMFVEGCSFTQRLTCNVFDSGPFTSHILLAGEDQSRIWGTLGGPCYGIWGTLEDRVTGSGTHPWRTVLPGSGAPLEDRVTGSGGTLGGPCYRIWDTWRTVLRIWDTIGGPCYGSGHPWRTVLRDLGHHRRTVLPGSGTPLEDRVTGSGAPLEDRVTGSGTPLRTVLPGSGAPLRTVLPGSGTPEDRVTGSGALLRTVLPGSGTPGGPCYWIWDTIEDQTGIWGTLEDRGRDLGHHRRTVLLIWDTLRTVLPGSGAPLEDRVTGIWDTLEDRVTGSGHLRTEDCVTGSGAPWRTVLPGSGAPLRTVLPGSGAPLEDRVTDLGHPWRTVLPGSGALEDRVTGSGTPWRTVLRIWGTFEDRVTGIWHLGGPCYRDLGHHRRTVLLDLGHLEDRVTGIWDTIGGPTAIWGTLGGPCYWDLGHHRRTCYRDLGHLRRTVGAVGVHPGLGYYHVPALSRPSVGRATAIPTVCVDTSSTHGHCSDEVAPMVTALMINLVFLVNIIRILVTKLRASDAA
ncbi:putative per-hexamer repeat protein 5-like, partial [Homarus americanus]